MSLPLELVTEIIHLLLFSAPPRSSTPEDPGFSTKPTWGTIDALSLTSHSYRALVLEAWFRTLFLWVGDLLFLRDSGWFPVLGSKWTKHLHCVESHCGTLWDLSSFLRVSSIRLDWLSPVFPPNWDTLPFLHLSSAVEHFDLRGRTWSEPGVILEHIANTPGFGRLKTLKIVQKRVCCTHCKHYAAVRVKDKATGVVYAGGLGLSIYYARVLAPLEYLEEVVIVIPNNGFGGYTLGSNADSGPDSMADTNPDTTPNININPNLWSGECDDCMVTMHHDDAFREKWLARKRCVGMAYGDGDNDDGQKDVRPPNLRRVEYQFCKVYDWGEEEED